jgi:hypothetical protein
MADECQPLSKYIEQEDRIEQVPDEDEQKLLIDNDVSRYWCILGYSL